MSTRSRLLLCALLPLLASPLTAATIVVDDLDDPGGDDGTCTLREAITAANNDAAYHGCPAGSGSDRIEFAGTGTITLASDLPGVTESLTIHGPGATDLTIDGDDLYRPFSVDGATTTLTLERLTVTGGSSTYGGALAINLFEGTGGAAVVRECVLTGNTATNGGGAVFAANEDVGASHLMIERSTIHDNEAQGANGGGGIRVGTGGTLSLRRSTVSGNRTTAVNGYGGGIMLFDPISAEISGSTISGNSASGEGGGVAILDSSYTPDVLIGSSTITGNTAGSDADAGDDGGGLFSSSTIATKLLNTVVAGNFDLGADDDYPDVAGGGFDSQGSNLIGDNSGGADDFPAGSPNLNGDFVGSSIAVIDPLLLALADYGGPTLTHAPSTEAESPIVDAGSCRGELSDQRGYFESGTWLRIHDSGLHADVDDGCDIGAVETGATEPDAGFLFASSFLADFAGWANVVGGP